MSAGGPKGPRPREAKPVPRPLEPLEVAAAATSRAFLCADTSSQIDDQHATTAFDLGRLYLDANHFEEAVVFLYTVAQLDPGVHAEVEYAARFLLDAMFPLSQERPECKAPFAEMVPWITAHVCEGQGSDDRAESCAAIAKWNKPETAPP